MKNTGASAGIRATVDPSASSLMRRVVAETKANVHGMGCGVISEVDASRLMLHSQMVILAPCTTFSSHLPGFPRGLPKWGRRLRPVMGKCQAAIHPARVIDPVHE